MPSRPFIFIKFARRKERKDRPENKAFVARDVRSSSNFLSRRSRGYKRVFRVAQGRLPFFLLSVKNRSIPNQLTYIAAHR